MGTHKKTMLRGTPQPCVLLLVYYARETSYNIYSNIMCARVCECCYGIKK